MRVKLIILKILLPILIITLIAFLPFFLDSKILLERNNDLSEFFSPIIFYIKVHIFRDGELPLWNTMFFAGNPLFPDPQNPSQYLPNIIFLFTSIDSGILISFFLHAFLGGIGAYLASKKGFGLTHRASLFASMLYIFSPKLMTYMEAGHFGLTFSWTYFPWIIYSAVNLIKTQRKRWSILLAIFLSAVFYTHVLTFGTTAVALIVFSLAFMHIRGIFNFRRLILIAVMYLLTFILISPILIPQLAWQAETTRHLLIDSAEIFPIWNGKKEFIKNIFTASRDTEKNITLGIATLYLCLFGGIKLSKKSIAYLFAATVLILLICLNNLSPIGKYLINQDWFILLRVATRFWFIIVLVSIFLAAYGFDALSRSKNRLVILVAILAVVESFSAGRYILMKNIGAREALPSEAYAFFKNDKDIYRIFCPTRCIPQKEAAVNSLELVEGYGTMQQLNFYYQSQKIAQSFWRNKYTLSLPPFEIYLYEDIYPSAEELAKFRVKYVVSKAPLDSKVFKKEAEFEKYTIYLNKLYLKPDYLIFTPNHIRIRIDDDRAESTIIAPEVYNKNWTAYLNGNLKTQIAETSDARMSIFINKNIQFIDLKFQPSFVQDFKSLFRSFSSFLISLR